MTRCERTEVSKPRSSSSPHPIRPGMWSGKAVDVGPVEADNWLIRNGSRFGLCQIYANEIWHFELAADEDGKLSTVEAERGGLITQCDTAAIRAATSAAIARVSRSSAA